MNELTDCERSKKLWGRVALISGLGILIPPMIGLVGTVVGMIRAFGTLKAAGAADPSELAGDISLALLTTLWGLGVSLISLIPFIVSLIIFLKLRRACAANHKINEAV